MRAVISLVAQGVIRDAQTNTISAFNILESLSAEGLPLFVPNIAYFVLWEREPNEPSIREATLNVRLEQTVLISVGARIDFQTFLRARSINQIAGLVLPSPGQLVFEMMVPDGPRATYTVTINAPAQVPPPRVEAH